MKDSIKIAIAGATGYVGIELVKILSRHPNAKICYLCAQKSIGMPIYKFDKKIKKKIYPKLQKLILLIGTRLMFFLPLYQMVRLKK